MALTSTAGEYELQFTGDRSGALLGPHEVRITTFAAAHDEFTPEGEAKTVPQRPELVPDKYNAKSQLKVDVQRGANRFDFELTSK